MPTAVTAAMADQAAPAYYIRPPGSAWWRPDDLISLSTEFDDFQAPTPELRAELWDLVDKTQGYKAIEHFLVQIHCDEYDPVRLLMDTNESGQAFLHHAAIKGDFTMLKALTSQVVFPTRHPPTPKYVVVLRQHAPMQQDEDGNTPLHIAASNGHLDFAKALIRFHDRDAITDPIDVNVEQVVGHETVQPLMEPAGQNYVNVSKKTHTYINIKNHAGRLAWEEARQAGAKDAAIWLEQYWQQCERIWQGMLQRDDPSTTQEWPY